jgi:hypothetical protein
MCTIKIRYTCSKHLLVFTWTNYWKELSLLCYVKSPLDKSFPLRGELFFILHTIYFLLLVPAPEIRPVLTLLSPLIELRACSYFLWKTKSKCTVDMNTIVVGCAVFFTRLKPMVDVISFMGRKNLFLRRWRVGNRFYATVSLVRNLSNHFGRPMLYLNSFLGTAPVHICNVTALSKYGRKLTKN